MRALVTGGGGFLGRYIVEQLLADQFQVRILARNEYPQLRDAGVECVSGDVRDPSVVLAACQDCEIVFHVAAVPGIWGPWRTFHSINTVGTQNVIDACRQARVGRLIYTSSPSVVYDGAEHRDANESLGYPSRYLCHYPHSKALAERAVLAANSSDLATVALRPHLIWGPRDNHLIPRLIKRAQQGRLMRVGTGENLISMSYVENAAAGHLQAARTLTPSAAHAGQAYFINEPEPVNLWQWIDQLLEYADLPPVSRRISAGAAWHLGHVLEWIYGGLRLKSEPPMTRFLAQQLSSTHTYSIQAAQRDFGFTPCVDMPEAHRRLAPELQRLAQSAPD